MNDLKPEELVELCDHFYKSGSKPEALGAFLGRLMSIPGGWQCIGGAADFLRKKGKKDAKVQG